MTNCGEIAMSFGLWLVVHDGKGQRAQRRWQGRGWVLEVLQKQGQRQQGRLRNQGGLQVKVADKSIFYMMMRLSS